MKSSGPGATPEFKSLLCLGKYITLAFVCKIGLVIIPPYIVVLGIK
jgi:hypothetical protein